MKWPVLPLPAAVLFTSLWPRAFQRPSLAFGLPCTEQSQLLFGPEALLLRPEALPWLRSVSATSKQ